MDIRIAGTVNDSIVDGPGFRYTIFTQGCPHRCEGCHNPETHDFQGGKIVDTEEIISEFMQNILLDGVTLSGGDPFSQCDACVEIARKAHEAGLNVWTYTGYTFEELIKGREDWKALLNETDVLVDGKFVLDKRSLECRFRGSTNQRLINVPKSVLKGEVVLFDA